MGGGVSQPYPKISEEEEEGGERESKNKAAGAGPPALPLRPSSCRSLAERGSRSPRQSGGGAQHREPGNPAGVNHPGVACKESCAEKVLPPARATFSTWERCVCVETKGSRRWGVRPPPQDGRRRSRASSLPRRRGRREADRAGHRHHQRGLILEPRSPNLASFKTWELQLPEFPNHLGQW